MSALLESATSPTKVSGEQLSNSQAFDILSLDLLLPPNPTARSFLQVWGSRALLLSPPRPSEVRNSKQNQYKQWPKWAAKSRPRLLQCTIHT